MPWTIILALLTFFVSKKSGVSTAGSLLAAGAVGYATHTYQASQTPNVATLNAGTGTQEVDADGKPVFLPNGNPSIKNADGSLVSEAASVLKSWGGLGTASVIGAGGLVAGASGTVNWWLIGGAAAILFFATR